MLGPLVANFNLAVSIFVLSYGTPGLLYLVNTSFSSPSAVLCVAENQFQFVPQSPIVVTVTVVRLDMECLPGPQDTVVRALALYMKQVLIPVLQWKGTRTCPPSNKAALKKTCVFSKARCGQMCGVSLNLQWWERESLPATVTLSGVPASAAGCPFSHKPNKCIISGLVWILRGST